MNNSFTLVLSSPVEISEALETAVYEAGCDDSMLFQQGGTVRLEFDREAVSLIDAIMSALDAVQGIEGVVVQRVGPEDLVTPAEVARRAGCSREAVRLWASGERGPGGFPLPVSGVQSRIKVWRWTEIRSWLHRSDPVKWPECDDAETIAVANALLTLGAASEAIRERLGMQGR